MCGIAGILQWDGMPEQPEINRMVQRLSHRGPDGQGTCLKGRVALGHRRLSIIDLENGQQPMFNEDGRVAVTFNGEIYNYRELRATLEARGHVFKSNSDTEVIVHGWEEWGKQCVQRMRGMFAFGIADWRNGVVFLARDQLGIKPLYYMRNSSRIAFASELQALHVLADFPATLDLQALDQYLFLQYIPAPKSIFKNVSKLQPAHRMLVDFSGRTEGPERYWTVRFNAETTGTLTDWSEELESVLRESVKAHLVADVPFGAFLSGGMDSTAIVGLMAQEMSRPVRTFSIGFGDTATDELPYAKQASERWATEHHSEIVHPDGFEILPSLVKHYGEPFGDSSAVPTYYVSRLARQSVPMVLSGDGGDEAFGGYDTYKGWLTWLEGPNYRRPAWKQALYPLLKKTMPFLLAPEPPPRRPSLARWMHFLQYVAPEVRKNLWRNEYRHLVDMPVQPFEQAYNDATTCSPGEMVRYMDLNTYLPADILTKVDITSMMHGLEVRTPIVDVPVIEWAARIPIQFTLAQNATGAWENKRILRAMLSKYFPASFINRPKMGFVAPVGKWMQFGSAIGDGLKDRLLDKSSAIYDYFEPLAILKMIDGHSNTSGMQAPLWLIFVLEEWLRHWRESLKEAT